MKGRQIEYTNDSGLTGSACEHSELPVIVRDTIGNIHFRAANGDRKNNESIQRVVRGRAIHYNAERVTFKAHALITIMDCGSLDRHVNDAGGSGQRAERANPCATLSARAVDVCDQRVSDYQIATTAIKEYAFIDEVLDEYLIDEKLNLLGVGAADQDSADAGNSTASRPVDTDSAQAYGVRGVRTRSEVYNYTVGAAGEESALCVFAIDCNRFSNRDRAVTTRIEAVDFAVNGSF